MPSYLALQNIAPFGQQSSQTFMLLV